MSDSNHEPNQLETLQQMLEAEMRGNPEPPKAPEKPAPAVAKPDDLGSLLGDLLSEAEKEVGRERPDDSVDANPQAARPASDRLPTRDMERADALESLSATLQETQSGMDGRRSSAPGNRNTMIVAAAAVIIAASLFAFLTQPKPEMALPDIGQRVGDTISKASLKWQAQEAKRQVEEARLLVEEAKKAEAAAKQKAAEAAKAADAAKASELAQAEGARAEAAKAASREGKSGDDSTASSDKPKKASKRRSGKRRRGKKLRIKTNVF